MEEIVKQNTIIWEGHDEHISEGLYWIGYRFNFCKNDPNNSGLDKVEIVYLMKESKASVMATRSGIQAVSLCTVPVSSKN